MGLNNLPPASWHWAAWFVSEEAILVDDEVIFPKFSATTREFLLRMKEFLQNFHKKYEGIEYS